MLSVYSKLVTGEKSRGDKGLFIAGSASDGAILWHEGKTVWLCFP